MCMWQNLECKRKCSQFDLEKLPKRNVSLKRLTICNIFQAVKKKGFQKRLEKVETRIRQLLMNEKELEILRRQQELNDYSEIRAHIQELATSQEDATAKMTQDISNSLKGDIMGQLKKDLLEDIAMTIKDEIKQQLGQCQHNQTDKDFPNLPTYANIAAKPPPPKPTIVITPKDNKVATYKLKHELNKCGSITSNITDCFATRGGKVIIKCPDDLTKQALQRAINEKTEISNLATVTESKPRFLRIMIFGGPQAPTQTTRFRQGEELPEEIKTYLQDFVNPALQKTLKKDLHELKYKLILLLQANRQKTHIVLELPEQDAKQLLSQGKILLGFNSCTTKRYVNVIRCFNCQRYGHITKNCPNPPTCVNCGESHPPDEQGEQSPCSAPPSCINCSERKKQEILLFKEKKISKYTIFTTSHRASDRQCEVYRSTLKQAQDKISNAENRNHPNS